MQVIRNLHYLNKKHCLVYSCTVDKIKYCRGCKSNSLDLVWELADSPYGDQFKNSQSEALALAKSSLTLMFCDNCTLLQISEIPNITEIYSNYLYRTTLTNALDSYYHQLSSRLIFEYKLSSKSTVIDIGSNDGTFLNFFKNQGIETLGIEPTTTSANQAISKGIQTFNGFLNLEACEFIKNNAQTIDLISINYTLANIDDLNSVFELLMNLMSDKTVLSIVTGYHPDQFLINMFEYINHDHLTYFTVKSLNRICSTFGLKIIDVSRTEHKGGSINVIISKNSTSWLTQSSVGQLIQREEWLECNDKSFASNLKLNIGKVSSEVYKLIDTGKFKKIYGIGASISTTHLISQFNLAENLTNIFDDDSNKHYKFAPGTGLKVLPLSDLPNAHEDVVIILAWQHTNKILERLKELNYSGKILIPLPSPKITTIEMLRF